MIAIVETISESRVDIISATDDIRLLDQLERLMKSNISSIAWSKLIDERETVDFGGKQVTIFDTNSLLSFTAKTHLTALIDIRRDNHNLTVKD